MVCETFKNKLKIVFVIMGLTVVVAGIVLVKQERGTRVKVDIFAHRGDHRKAPENTIPAFEEAIKNGADGIELDVTQSRDGELIVVHDDNLARIAGVDQNVWDLTFDEIQQIDVGVSSGSGYAGTRIPSLRQVLELCNGKTRLYIELKYNGHETPDFVERVLQMIEDEKMEKECLVASFHYEFVEQVKALNPKITSGLIFYEEGTSWNQYSTADLFSVHYEILTDEMVKEMHEAGKGVYVWTVDREEEAQRCIEWGVDCIVTNSLSIGEAFD